MKIYWLAACILPLLYAKWNWNMDHIENLPKPLEVSQVINSNMHFLAKLFKFRKIFGHFYALFIFREILLVICNCFTLLAWMYMHCLLDFMFILLETLILQLVTLWRQEHSSTISRHGVRCNFPCHAFALGIFPHHVIPWRDKLEKCTWHHGVTGWENIPSARSFKWSLCWTTDPSISIMCDFSKCSSVKKWKKSCWYFNCIFNFMHKKI